MQKNFSDIQFVVFDFDGVFTDNRVIVDQNGVESVMCSRADGIGLSRIRKLGMDMMILSTETNNVVQKRAKKLGICCINGSSDKLHQLKIEAKQRNLEMNQIAFVGNDINDMECLKSVGFPIVVADAEEEVVPFARYVTKRKGGKGAVREVCDLIYDAVSNDQRAKL